MATHGTAITPAWYQLESIQMCVISAQLSKESAPLPPLVFHVRTTTPVPKKLGWSNKGWKSKAY